MALREESGSPPRAAPGLVRVTRGAGREAPRQAGLSRTPGATLIKHGPAARLICPLLPDARSPQVDRRRGPGHVPEAGWSEDSGQMCRRPPMTGKPAPPPPSMVHKSKRPCGAGWGRRAHPYLLASPPLVHSSSCDTRSRFAGLEVFRLAGKGAPSADVVIAIYHQAPRRARACILAGVHGATTAVTHTPQN